MSGTGMSVSPTIEVKVFRHDELVHLQPCENVDDYPEEEYDRDSIDEPQSAD